MLADEFVSISSLGRYGKTDAVEACSRYRLGDVAILHDPQVIRIGPNNAVVTYEYDCKILSASGELVEARKGCRVTFVWEQRGGGWVIVFCHDNDGRGTRGPGGQPLWDQIVGGGRTGKESFIAGADRRGHAAARNVRRGKRHPPWAGGQPCGIGIRGGRSGKESFIAGRSKRPRSCRPEMFDAEAACRLGPGQPLGDRDSARQNREKSFIAGRSNRPSGSSTCLTRVAASPSLKKTGRTPHHGGFPSRRDGRRESCRRPLRQRKGVARRLRPDQPSGHPVRSTRALRRFPAVRRRADPRA